MLKKLGLTAILSLNSIIAGGIDLKLPEIKNKTQITYDLGMKKIQYNFPLSKKTFLFSEYNKPQLQNYSKINFDKISLGFKIKF